MRVMRHLGLVEAWRIINNDALINYFKPLLSQENPVYNIL